MVSGVGSQPLLSEGDGRTVAPSSSPAITIWIGLVVGIIASIAYGNGSANTLRNWFGDDKSPWGFAYFQAFGAMSGFALAALTFAAGLSNHARAQEALEADEGRFLLRMLMRSTIWWLVPALLGLLAIVWDIETIRVAAIITTFIAAAQGVLTMYALRKFFLRFTRHKGYVEAQWRPVPQTRVKKAAECGSPSTQG